MQSLPGKVGSQVCISCPMNFLFHGVGSSLFIILVLSIYLGPNLAPYGYQDVNDVLDAIDLAIAKGLADPSKIAVVGGSHGGFLTTHLIGQV